MSNAQEDLAAMFDAKKVHRFTSNVEEPERGVAVQELLIDPEERARLPITRADYVIKEDPRLVEWERVVRQFLARLNSNFGHKVNAPMIFEWATGVNLAELREAEKVDPKAWRGGARWGSANVHLRHINKILKEYFGDPRKTTIMGRHVGKAYTVRPSFRVKLKRPACLTLWPEWNEGTLDKK